MSEFTIQKLYFFPNWFRIIFPYDFWILCLTMIPYFIWRHIWQHITYICLQGFHVLQKLQDQQEFQSCQGRYININPYSTRIV
jgi:hypothetical protein